MMGNISVDCGAGTVETPKRIDHKSRVSLDWVMEYGGHYYERTGRYRIDHDYDDGIWILTGRQSLTRYCSGLWDAKMQAEAQERLASDRQEIGKLHGRPEIVRREAGWIILSRSKYGVWREIGGPYRTRSIARQVLSRST